MEEQAKVEVTLKTDPQASGDEVKQEVDNGEKRDSLEKGVTEANRKDDAEYEPVLKEGTVKYQGERRNLQITATRLKIEVSQDNKKNNDKALEILWKHVICAKPVATKVSEELQKTSFIVHYIYVNKRKLQLQSFNLVTLGSMAEDWIAIIQDRCSKVEGRPKKVFVICNTIGGSGNGRQVYEKKVCPILELAQIQAEVLFTEKAKHALETCENTDFSPYDCVMIMGGDGSYQEVLHGMFLHKQREAGVDYNNVKSKMAPLDTPILLIPTGTGNGVAGMMNNGSKDYEGAVLRMLIGEKLSCPIFAVHSNNKFLTVCGMVFNYGDLADFFRRMEELRWMGRFRYLYGIASWLFTYKRNSRYEVEYCLVPGCQQNESNVYKTADKETEESQEGGWIKHPKSGEEFTGLFANTIYPEDKGDRFELIYDCVDRFRLYLDYNCGRVALLKNTMSLFFGKKLPTPPGLEIIDNVQAVKMRLVRDEVTNDAELTGAASRIRTLELSFGSDGEVYDLEKSEFEIWILPSFVRLYGCKVEM